MVISYLNEEDAEDTKKCVEAASQTAVLVAGELSDAVTCREVIALAVEGISDDE